MVPGDEERKTQRDGQRTQAPFAQAPYGFGVGLRKDQQDPAHGQRHEEGNNENEQRGVHLRDSVCSGGAATGHSLAYRAVSAIDHGRIGAIFLPQGAFIGVVCGKSARRPDFPRFRQSGWRSRGLPRV
ncbi:hypothetical protein SDC9_181340 [bioreactor metagenome]|uniref:Uncharacterized protein n=1 Tax=bioreactor metagenome TaxID=1076179 RepID=A0A645H499_9ZZZZ